MYHVYFDFSTGLKAPINTHEGDFQSTLNYIARVEQRLGLVRDERGENTPRWVRSNFDGVSDDVLCDTAREHNEWVRTMYNYWASKPGGPEVITPEMADKIWHALTFIRVEPRRWTASYYRDNMERLFDVMVKGERDGISFDLDPLTVKQAEQVVVLFSEFLDTHDVRLAVPDGYDFLTIDENCQWCSIKAIHIYTDDGCESVAQCREDCLFVEWASDDN